MLILLQIFIFTCSRFIYLRCGAGKKCFLIEALSFLLAAVLNFYLFHFSILYWVLLNLGCSQRLQNLMYIFLYNNLNLCKSRSPLGIIWLEKQEITELLFSLDLTRTVPLLYVSSHFLISLVFFFYFSFPSFHLAAFSIFVLLFPLKHWHYIRQNKYHICLNVMVHTYKVVEGIKSHDLEWGGFGASWAYEANWTIK